MKIYLVHFKKTVAIFTRIMFSPVEEGYLAYVGKRKVHRKQISMSATSKRKSSESVVDTDVNNWSRCLPASLKNYWRADIFLLCKAYDVKEITKSTTKKDLFSHLQEALKCNATMPCEFDLKQLTASAVHILNITATKKSTPDTAVLNCYSICNKEEDEQDDKWI